MRQISNISKRRHLATRILTSFHPSCSRSSIATDPINTINGATPLWNKTKAPEPLFPRVAGYIVARIQIEGISRREQHLVRRHFTRAHRWCVLVDRCARPLHATTRNLRVNTCTNPSLSKSLRDCILRAYSLPSCVMETAFTNETVSCFAACLD